MNNVSSSNSQKALVPELRFPEFRDEWKKEKLSDFVVRVTRKNKDNQSNLPLTISSKDGLVDHVTYFNKKVSSKDMSGYYLLKNGEFAYNKSYSVGYDFGSIKRLDMYDEGALSTLYICFALKKHHSDFIKTYFDSLKWYKEIYMIAAEGARNHGLLNVTTEDFFDTIHTLPKSIDEQTKIADFLTLLEQCILKQEKLVNALKLYKRGFLSSVFNDKNTIQNNWKKHKIKDFLSSRDYKQLPSDDAPLMAFIAYKGVVPKGERYDRSFLVKDENKLYKYTDMNDFIYSSNNLDVGSIGLNNYGPAVISDVYEIFTINKAVPIIISEAIKQPEVLYKIIKFRQGVTYGQYRIYAEDFLNVEIYLPDISEQEKLAKTIISMNSLIQSEEKLLADLTNLKLSLLQKMFI